MTDITLTMPDGAKRVGQGRHDRPRRGEVDRAVAGQAHGRHDARWRARGCCRRHHARMRRSSSSRARDPEALELIRHDCAHVLAEAVQDLWPGTQVTIGPVIEHGFYLRLRQGRAVRAGGSATIEKRMREIIAKNAPFTKEVWSRDKAKAHFQAKGEHFKVELVDAIPAGEDLKIYTQGAWLDLCRGPHMTSTGQIGNGVQADPVLRQLLARRCQGPAAAAHLRHRVGQREGAGRASAHARGGREARPPQARPRDGPLPFPGRRARHRVLASEGLGAVPGTDQLHAPPPAGRRLRRGQLARS